MSFSASWATARTDLRVRSYAALGIFVGVWICLSQSLSAQEVQGNDPRPIAPPPIAAEGGSREEALEARIRELEKTANERAQREAQLEQRLKALEKLLSKDAEVRSVSGAAIETQQPPDDAPAGEEAMVRPFDELQVPDVTPPQSAAPAGTLADRASAAAKSDERKPDMPFKHKEIKAKAAFGQGFSITSEDEEYQIQFHDLTQIDYRQYNQPEMYPTHSSFGFPRQWFIFNGRITKPVEYLVIINNGFANLNLLDAYVNLNFDERFQLKIGRFKTPWSYEFYGQPANGLINPERSLVFNNFGENRDTGVMLWGQIFDKTSDYAVGVFNGVRNGYVDNNDAKAVMAYLNFRPLERTGAEVFKYWNVGGSVFWNVYNDRARPELFRTNVPYPGDATMSPLWLELNKDTYAFGTQQLWSLHSALFYKQLSLAAEWYSGFETYAHKNDLLNGTKVANGGWYAQAGYFLTGETVTSRGLVKPLNEFDPRKLNGLGAWELGFRWANQTLDKSVFQFAPESKWTNDADVVDLGLNWYWNVNLKFYFGWQRAMFGRPIQAAPGVNPNGPPQYWMTSSDMLWLRAQLYY